MQRFKKHRDAVDPSRTDLTAWSDLIDLEEDSRPDLLVRIHFFGCASRPPC